MDLDDLFGWETEPFDYDEHPYEWTDKERVMRSIFEMKTSHLMNAMKFIRIRSTEKSKPAIYYNMLLELVRRGAIQLPYPPEA